MGYTHIKWTYICYPGTKSQWQEYIYNTYQNVNTNFIQSAKTFFYDIGKLWGFEEWEGIGRLGEAQGNSTEEDMQTSRREIVMLF